MSDFGTIEDGFGSVWHLCREDCELEIVRPGKVQCECDWCGFKNPCDAVVHQPGCASYEVAS